VPVTPFHLFPALPVYFVFYRRLNGLAFFIGTFLIDLEPVIYMFLGVPFPTVPLLFGGFARQGYHMITHNPFSILVIVGPAMFMLTKFLELGKSLLLNIFPSFEWVNYSWKRTYLSVLLGSFLHFSWDVTMHWDINLGFPFVDIRNPFVNSSAMSMIFIVSLILILPTYFVGKKINGGNPFKKLP